MTKQSLEELKVVLDELKAYRDKSFDAVKKTPEWATYFQDQQEVDELEDKIRDLEMSEEDFAY